MQICQALPIITLLVQGAVAQEQIDTSTQAFQMHNCPVGFAMAGAHVSHNRFLCVRTKERDQDCFVDYATQRNGMHACPVGTYMRGFREDRNELTCCFERSRGYTVFSGQEFVDQNGHSQAHGMHVCPNAVLTGIHVSHNDFLCRPVPNSPAPIANPITIGIVEDQNRSFLNPAFAGIDAHIWQSVTRNWLLRILNVPIDGSWQRAPTIVVDSTQDMGAGVIQKQIHYVSPIDGHSIAPALLTFPSGYSPSGHFPAVLITHGHNNDTMFSPGSDWNSDNHAAALFLAQNGFITLAPEIVSFGGYIANDHGNYVSSHLPGTLPQQYLLDNLVRISLLQSVPGVDGARIASAGLSLGGYQALWLGALDERISSVIVGGLYLNMECLNSPSQNHSCQTVPSLARDFETNPNSSTSSGSKLLINTSDLAALIAPRRLLAMWGTADPNFSTGQSACRVAATSATQSVYHRFGSPANFLATQTAGMGHEFNSADAVKFLVGAEPRIQRDWGTQCSGMHCCPAGMAIIGVRIDNNQFLCMPLGSAQDEHCSVNDPPGSQRQGMHACPADTYAQGLHAGTNKLVCCHSPHVALASERLDTGTQLEGMHGCANGTEVLTGIHVSDNKILCSAVTSH